MFTTSSLPVERPADWRSKSYDHSSRSAYNSPAGSRRNSGISIASAHTDPGLTSDKSRQSSASSKVSDASGKSGFRGLFGKKEKKPKEKKDVDKIILTSKHAAAVKTKMMLDPRYKDRTPVKTAEITQSTHSAHLSAADQEYRHPHSGPPALHSKTEMPLLTRIVSGDERDDEDEFDRVERARLEWDILKTPAFAKIREHESDDGAYVSAEQLSDEDSTTPPAGERALSPGIEKALYGNELRRPLVVTKNSYGGRFHRDDNGYWKR